MLNVLTGQRGYANAKKLWLFNLSAMVPLLSGCMGGNQAEFSLNSNAFSLRTALEFSQKNQLQKHITSDREVRINGETVQMDKLAVRGGIFGPEGQNAGLVFGFRNSDTHVTGIATDQRK